MQCILLNSFSEFGIEFSNSCIAEKGIIKTQQQFRFFMKLKVNSEILNTFYYKSLSKYFMIFHCSLGFVLEFFTVINFANQDNFLALWFIQPIQTYQ